MIKIYKLVCDQTELVYVGRTGASLSRRFTNHKSDFTCKRGCCSSKILFGMGKVSIHLLEECDKSIKKERERYWYEKLPCINKQVPNRSHKKSNQIYNLTKINCEFCRSIVCKGSIRRHQKSKKCLNAR